MSSSYDGLLVALSYLVSVMGSFIALLLTKYALMKPEQERGYFRLLAAIALGGVGIWSMHFIGMLAFELGIPITYDWLLTTASLLIAVLVVYGGFMAITRGSLGIPKLVLAGTIVGIGVAAMHYTGMEAMQLQAEITYDLGIVAVSIVIAIVASTVALWLAANVAAIWQMVFSALVMGVAVCGMHYTGMAAAIFTENKSLPAVDPWAMSNIGFAFVIMVVDTLIIFWGAWSVVFAENARLQLEAKKALS
jgi:NO-binding membrane sensor protein with MHYT domain